MPGHTASDEAWAQDWARSCEMKTPMSAAAARTVARIQREKGIALEAYPCRHDHPGRWHVGKPLSLEAMARLLRLIRIRAGHAPGPPRSRR
jgi:hypothetical protein